ncbi:DUF6000 family protein [Actinacidiphila acididurans]|uniref:Uncharacterized protein n=1 Tax=Actinacidiphila acididurans TaxID=2784346 RepID=A0ABS2TX82_9ACTN|nr:DUF6000 family protein [Actinacidiphila acididurans]MBM9506573.1 hypothetical protein [Actinacidiphila acididurans]
MKSVDPRTIGMGHVVPRYVAPAHEPLRYLQLMSLAFYRMEEPEQSAFVRTLVVDAAVASDAELDALLRGQWRFSLTGTWLCAVGLRTRLRGRIAELLFAGANGYCNAYCLALARFGTLEDAQILSAYLERYLPRTDLRWEQSGALGALLRLDAGLGTDYAARFTVPGGLWDGWFAGWTGWLPSGWTVERLRDTTDALCDFHDGWTTYGPPLRATPQEKSEAAARFGCAVWNIGPCAGCAAPIHRYGRGSTQACPTCRRAGRPAIRTS